MMFSIYFNRKERGVNFMPLLYLFFFVTLFLLFNSCEQDMNIEIKTNDKRLLVDGEFTNDTTVHSLRLYCSGSLISGKPQTTVSGAMIYITDNVDTFFYAENKDTLGLYQTSKCFGKGGHRYTLTIKNIDIDKNGITDLYTSNNLMPVPVKYYSLVTKRGLNGDGNMAVNNKAYFKLSYDGPGYVYPFCLVNNISRYTITDRLGSGEINRFENEYKVPKVLNPGSEINYSSYQSINSSVIKGDVIRFIGINLTNNQYSFLKEFDNNTNGDSFVDNIYDQLKMPANLTTNIESSNDVAGYFFVYSVSSISKVWNE